MTMNEYIDSVRRALRLDDAEPERRVPQLGPDRLLERRHALLEIHHIILNHWQAVWVYQQPLRDFFSEGLRGKYDRVMPGERSRAWDRREEYKNARSRCREKVMKLAREHRLFDEAEQAWDLFWLDPITVEVSEAVRCHGLSNETVIHDVTHEDGVHHSWVRLGAYHPEHVHARIGDTRAYGSWS